MEVFQGGGGSVWDRNCLLCECWDFSMCRTFTFINTCITHYRKGNIRAPSNKYEDTVQIIKHSKNSISLLLSDITPDLFRNPLGLLNIV